MDVTEAQNSQKSKETKKLRTWINSLFVIVLLFAFPLLYFFGYISNDWANRMGMIMNFLAGFLIAPELIGEERLIKAEGYLEKQLQKINSRSTKARTVIENYSFELSMEDDINQQLPVAFLGALFIYIIFPSTIYGLLLIIILVATLHLLALQTIKKLPLLGRVLQILERLLVYILGFVGIGSFGILLGLLYFVVIHAMFSLMIKLSKAILSALGEDHRLRYILIWWGVILFILGNALQFLSTF